MKVVWEVNLGRTSRGSEEKKKRKAVQDESDGRFPL